MVCNYIFLIKIGSHQTVGPTKAGAVSVCSLLSLQGLAPGLAPSGAPQLFVVTEESSGLGRPDGPETH